ncbi:helix-turn-helix domain-containing protein [Chitinophaga pendula]|uniref:helix-turn-helix domain-containing protein n=1 Tax=Chitinophaga pendula TaxID=2849666 RepID=UPI001CED4E2D|nr:helix-turn-helix transcriptional regulator [Chitinophaga pendula]UCJ06488.1 helix-turn-helix domain-containing protein [Chitinophaga pendula]
MQARFIHMGQRLKLILKQKKIKIVEFAAMAGFTNQIAHYHLRKSDMKRSTLEKFCNLIGITTDEFFDWKGVAAGRTDNNNNIHHGQRLQELISERGLNKTRLARRLGMSRRTMYNLFDKEIFSPEELERAVRSLETSVTAFLRPGTAEESRQAESDEMMAMREKYYKLLEEHNQLLKNHSALKETLEQVKKDIVQLRKQIRTKK